MATILPTFLTNDTGVDIAGYNVAAATDCTYAATTGVYLTYTTGYTVICNSNAITIQAPGVTFNEPDPEMVREWERQCAQRMTEEVASQERAKRLLLMMLTAAQRADYERHGFFVVVGQSGKRYRVRRGRHGNVYELNARETPIASYCASPLGVPDEDAMLAQKLQLENDEAEFLRVANRTAIAA